MDQTKYIALKLITKVALNHAHDDTDLQAALKIVWAWMVDYEHQQRRQ